jgi:hypothetical protein
MYDVVVASSDDEKGREMNHKNTAGEKAEEERVVGWLFFSI